MTPFYSAVCHKCGTYARIEFSTLRGLADTYMIARGLWPDVHGWTNFCSWKCMVENLATWAAATEVVEPIARRAGGGR